MKATAEIPQLPKAIEYSAERLFPVEPLIDGRGVTHPAPNRWRFADDPHAMAAVQAFYVDLLWAFTYELDGVVWWPGRRRRNAARSLTGALGDVARIWGIDAVGPHSGPRQYNRGAP
ncbi:MAG TPA: hypothetical protein VF711_04970 [Acidimicrobiales bacterium]